MKFGKLIPVFLAFSATISLANEKGNGGGEDILLAGYVAKYMTYHYKAATWLEKSYADGSLEKKLSLDKDQIHTPDGRPITAELVMDQFNLGSAANVKVEFLPSGHSVNEKIQNVPSDRICGNLPAEHLIVCSVDQWDLAERGEGKDDYAYGAAIFGALDIHERLGVAGLLEQNEGLISQYPISSRILEYRKAVPSVDYEYTDQLFSTIDPPTSRATQGQCLVKSDVYMRIVNEAGDPAAVDKLLRRKGFKLRSPNESVDDSLPNLYLSFLPQQESSCQGSWKNSQIEYQYAERYMPELDITNSVTGVSAIYGTSSIVTIYYHASVNPDYRITQAQKAHAVLDALSKLPSCSDLEAN